MEAYLRFCAAKRKPWSWIFKKNFGHIIAYVQKESGGWLCLNPCSNILQVYHESEIIASNHMEEGDTIIRLSVLTNSKTKLGRLFSCVSLIKYILGIDLPGITPYGLYKACVKKKHPGIISCKIIQ